MNGSSLLCTDLRRSSVGDCKELTIELSRPEDHLPRYTIIVCDKSKIKDKGNMSYGAFIVPQGRNYEWLFGVAQGRKNLVESSGFDRLAIIFLQRDLDYSEEEVEGEVYSTIVKLSPTVRKTHLLKNTRVPFVSIGEDNGCRTISGGESQLSGEYIIDETEGKRKDVYRRLIFVSAPNCIQSECRLIKVRTKRKQKTIVDYSYLSFEHHKFMVLGVAMVYRQQPFNVLVVGLGGGALSMYLHICFKQATITSVEIDPEIYKIAKKYFGLKTNEKLKVEITDGIQFLHSASQKGDTFDAILIDVDNKESASGVSCPPIGFLQTEFLRAVASCLHDEGVFILNLATQDSNIRSQVCNKVGSIFKQLHSVKIEQDLNELLYCWKTEPKMTFEHAAKQLNSIVRNKLTDEEFISVSKLSGIVPCKSS